MKPILIVATVLILMLSACAPKATPTVDPAQVQASAVAAASTMVAMTQAAIPTDTPVPPADTPTDTPQPTPTILPLSTAPITTVQPTLPAVPVIAVQPTLAAAPTSSGGGCQFLKVSKSEPMATFLVINQTNEEIGVTFYLQKNAFGDCGYWSSTISSGGSLTITNLPQGCYSFGTWTLAGKPNFQNLGYPVCANSSQKVTIKATIATNQIY
jgi:hypothetical protein